MITKKRKFNLETTGSTLNYTITSDSNCMTISPSTGTDIASGTTIEFTFTLQDENCFSSQIVLSVQDSEGCDTDTYTFQLENDCDINATLTNQPSSNNPYIFLLAVTSPIVYTTTWQYDTTVFTEVGTTNSSLELELIGTEQLDNSEITATIKSQDGCTKVVKYNYAFCNPTALDIYANLVCVPEGTITKTSSGRKDIQLNVTACSGTSIDYRTLELSYNTSKLLVSQSSTDSNILSVYAFTANTSAGEYHDIEYRVQDDEGRYSNYATIRVKIPDCTVTNNPTIPVRTIELKSTDTSGTVFRHSLEDSIISARDIDWSTFSFIANTGQTLVSATQLTATNGSASFSAGNREVLYTVGTQNENVDLVEFRVSDDEGYISTRGLLYVNAEALTAPVATGESVTVGKNSTTTIDITANDTGYINYNTLEIITSPTKGVVFIDKTAGTVDYIADDNSGADSFTYRYYTVDGQVSNTATVSITIENSGTGTTQTICKSASIDFYDYILGSVTAGGTWSKDAGNPSDLTITDPTDVDFSSALPGTYNFTYTLSEDETTITLIIADNGISLLNLSTFMAGPSGSTYPVHRYDINITGIANNTNLYAVLDYDSGTKFTTFYPVIFYPEGGVAEIDVLLDDGAGDYNITIYGVDVCGTTHNFTTPTTTI